MSAKFLGVKRLSGIQRDVLKLYRCFLRESKKKGLDDVGLLVYKNKFRQRIE